MSKQKKIVGYGVWGVRHFWHDYQIKAAKFGLFALTVTIVTVIYLLLEGKL